MEAEKKSVCHYVWKAMGQRCTKTPYGEGQGLVVYVSFSLFYFVCFFCLNFYVTKKKKKKKKIGGICTQMEG